MKPHFASRFREIRHVPSAYSCQVFVASDEFLQQRDVVVKIFPARHFTYDLAQLTKGISRYRGLRHPHLATILDAGLTHKKEFFYVREYFTGPVAFSSENAALLHALLNTALFLYSTNAVHGGIKPSNLFTHDDSLRLVDPQ